MIKMIKNLPPISQLLIFDKILERGMRAGYEIWQFTIPASSPLRNFQGTEKGKSQRERERESAYEGGYAGMHPPKRETTERKGEEILLLSGSSWFRKPVLRKIIITEMMLRQ